MRIAVLTSVHPPTDTRIYFKQVRALQEAGHDVVLIARSGERTEGVRHIELPVPGNRAARLGTIVQLARHAIRLRCDAYHLHDPELLLIVPLLKLTTGARIVFDVHENIRQQIGNKYWIPRTLRRIVSRLYAIVENLTLHWADHVVLAEDSYEGDYERWKPTIVRNYPILPEHVESDRPRTYSGLPRLAYCGVVARIRGGLEMLEATARLRDTHPGIELHVIGPFFPREFENEMKDRIVELGLEDHVRLYGRLPLDAALRQVATCDVGLALLHPDPNYLESLPTKMFEYMSLRMPVVVSDFPLWKGIVDDAKCGSAVNPLEASEVATAITGIVADNETQCVLGSNGRRAVLSRYSWDVEKAKLLQIYDDARRPSEESPQPRPAPALPV